MQHGKEERGAFCVIDGTGKIGLANNFKLHSPLEGDLFLAPMSSTCCSSSPSEEGEAAAAAAAIAAAANLCCCPNWEWKAAMAAAAAAPGWWNEAGILCRVPDSPMPSSSSDFLRWQESSFSRISITDISDGGRASSAPAARMRRKFGSAEVEGGSGPPGSRFMFVTCDGPSSCYN